jgi:hypothetical protein
MNTDQEQFDEHVNDTGKLVLWILAGVGIFGALTISILALVISSNRMDMSPGAAQVVAPAGQTVASHASIMIDHVTRGCHTLAVNGAAPGAPSATIHLSAGGVLHVQNNDVMPQRIVRVSGPQAQFVTAAMSHMGARSSVTFATPGTYSLTTRAGEDYMAGMHTIGPDNTLHIKVLVAA